MAQAKQSQTAPPADKPKRARKPKQESTVTTPATQLEEAPVEKPPVFDLVGEDDRRLARSWSRDSCKDLQARITAQTGEKTRIVPASPFSSVQVEQP